MTKKRGLKMTQVNAISLGNNNGQKLYSEGYQHILLLAPHGTGKGVCFVIPTLLSYDESCIVHDIKFENYQLTSKYRASIGHKIFIWNPLGEETHRYNPLDFINKNPKKIVDDISKIADLLIGGCCAYNVDAKNLFISIVLYLLANTEKTKSFGEIARMLHGDLVKLFDEIKNIHPVGNQNITAFLKKDKEEQNAIIRTLNKYLAPWHNPLIDAATSSSDFDIADLKKEKITLYIGVNPSDIERLQPVMQFFYNHAIERLVSTAQEIGYSDKNGGVCLLMDEFYSVGKLKMLTSCMPYFRGYKIKLFLISANIGKIEKIYGDIDTQNIISDCTFKVFFTPNDYKTANEISKLYLTLQEIINLPADSQIVVMDKEQPIILKKSFYYNDEEMKKRITNL